MPRLIEAMREDETGLVITLKLIPNPELTQLLLSYGAEVKVVKPEALKESIARILERAVQGNSY